MLDGKAYQARFPDDPAYDVSISSAALRRLNSAALMEAFAALEDDFRTILQSTLSSLGE
jgi:hypothetical protein